MKRGALWGRMLVVFSCMAVVGFGSVADAATPPRTLRLISGGRDNTDVFVGSNSADGSRVFLTTRERLKPDEDGDAAVDIYERDADGTLRLLSGGRDDADAVFGGNSADGSRVFFTTRERLKPDEDGDAAVDIYERDADGTLRLLTGGTADEPVTGAGNSVDGSRVFFLTREQLKPAEDQDLTADVYERDADGTLVLITGGTAQPVSSVSISADGRRVFFQTTEQLLISKDNDLASDIYERDADGALQLVSDGTAAAVSFNGSSADGARVFFSTSERLLPEDADPALDVYKREAGRTLLVSVGNEDAAAQFSAFSADGARVFFLTTERLLPGKDGDTARDIYERDADGTLRLISGGTEEVDAVSFRPSANCARVSFRTSERLLPEDTDSTLDIYGRDTDETLRLISGGTQDVDASFDAVSADCARVYFHTSESLVPEDRDTANDVYEHDLDGTLRLISGGTDNVAASISGLSADGSRVFFQTTESLAGTGDVDAAADVYEVALAVPSFAGGAVVKGSARVGSRVSCVPGGFVGESVTSTIAWMRDGNPIAGALGDGYTIVKADSDHRLACRVTLRNPIGSGSQTSPAVLVDTLAPVVRISSPRCPRKMGKAACKRFQRSVRAWARCVARSVTPSPRAGWRVLR